VAPVTFTEVGGGTQNPDVMIGWRPAEDPDRSMVGNVHAHAAFPPSCSGTDLPKPIHFDETETTWAIGAVREAMDVEFVALHEMGHILGLAHSTVAGAVNWPFSSTNSTERVLTDDDIAGVRQLYPPHRLAAGTYTVRHVSSGRFLDAHETSIDDHGAVTVPAVVDYSQRWDLSPIATVCATRAAAGSASHDYAVDEVYVPAERSWWFMEPPVEDGPLYQMAPIAMFACFISAVCLGIARHALAEYIELSQTKVPVLSDAVLADKPVANTKLGRAKALIESGHAYVRAALAQQWDAVCGGHRPTMAERGAQWLAAAHAGQTALDAVELLYSAGGADSIYATSALDRCLRDVRTAVQHICPQEVNYEVAGRLAAGRLEATMASHWIIDYRNEGLV
jgi:hypothetical protein